MAHSILQLDWKLLEILRKKRLVHCPLQFTNGLKAFRNVEK